MDPGQWDKPVTYHDGYRGGYRTIASTDEAARVLLEGWPVEKGKAFFGAQKVFLAVLKGKRLPEEARRAFLKAASEANIFVRDQ